MLADEPANDGSSVLAPEFWAVETTKAARTGAYDEKMSWSWGEVRVGGRLVR